MKKHLTLLAKLAVMGTLLALLYRKADFATFRGALAGLKWGWLPGIFGLFLVNSSLSAWKWKLLLASDGVEVPFPRLLSSYLIGSFFNLFLPSSIGGDSYRVVDASRHGGGAKSFASVFADRLSGFLALASWGLLFTLVGWGHLPDSRILWLPVAVFGIMACMVFAVVQRRMLEGAMRLLRIDRLGKLHGFARKVLDSVAVYGASRALLAKVFAMSLLFQMLAITIIFCISKAMGWEVPFTYFCIFVPLITLGEALPISIFGIGVRDGLYSFFFEQGGASHEQALAMALVYVLLTLAYSLLGGILFVMRRSPAPRPGG